MLTKWSKIIVIGISNVYILYRIKNGIMYILFEINHNLYLLKEKDLYDCILPGARTV